MHVGIKASALFETWDWNEFCINLVLILEGIILSRAQLKSDTDAGGIFVALKELTYLLMKRSMSNVEVGAVIQGTSDHAIRILILPAREDCQVGSKAW